MLLEEQINAFIEYCKASGFRDKSIESLSIRLNQFKKFLITARLRIIKSIAYRHLSRFVADYKNPSIHVKKARVWSLRQFLSQYVAVARPPFTGKIVLDLGSISVI